MQGGISTFDSISDETPASLQKVPASLPAATQASGVSSSAMAKPDMHTVMSAGSSEQPSKVQILPNMTAGKGENDLTRSNAEAFLPGPEGLTLDVRMFRVEQDFSPFAAGIRE